MTSFVEEIYSSCRQPNVDLIMQGTVCDLQHLPTSHKILAARKQQPDLLHFKVIPTFTLNMHKDTY